MPRQKEQQTPKPSPKPQQINDAVQALSDQHLHVYQLLYFQNLTTPTGPLKIRRVISSLGTATVLLSVTNESHFATGKGLFFNVRPETPDEEILEKAKLLLDGNTKEKPFHEACCVYAERRFCVCRISFTCPLHGSTCIGTHD